MVKHISIFLSVNALSNIKILHHLRNYWLESGMSGTYQNPYLSYKSTVIAFINHATESVTTG